MDGDIALSPIDRAFVTGNGTAMSIIHDGDE
jgi:hypothetical protein